MIDLVFLNFMRKLVLSLFFIVVCAFDFYGTQEKNDAEENNFTNKIDLGETYQMPEDNSQLFLRRTNQDSYYSYMKKQAKHMAFLQKEEKKNEKMFKFLKNPAYSRRINKYQFAKTLPNDEDFVSLWSEDFEVTCKKLFPKEATDDFKTFLKFYFCYNKIIDKILKKKDSISKFGPFLSDNKERVKDFLEEDMPLLRQKVSLARRVNLKKLLEKFIQNGANKCKCEEMMKKHIKGVIGVFKNSNNLIKGEALDKDTYKYLYSIFVLQNKDSLNKLYVRDLLSANAGDGFIDSIVKHRTLLFRFIPTFIYNIFDLGRFLKDFYTYSDDGRYSLSIYNVPLILGKTSPLFFDLFQFDFFLNFPLGIFLSCLDFCAYSIIRGDLNENEKKRYSLFQRFFWVWRPFVSDDFDIHLILKKSEKEENVEEKNSEKENFENEGYYNAFSSVVLKVLTNFVGVNFNIKISGKYFFSINLMSFVDDFILREYFLDSFNCFNKDLRPSSWSIFYETNNKEWSNRG